MSRIAPEDVLGIVLAHRGAQDAVARHMPYWRKFAEEIAIFTPVDGRLENMNEIGLTYDAQQSIGWSAKYSPQTNLRCREALRYAAWRGRPYTVLLEWDAMIWGPWPDQATIRPGEVASWTGTGHPRVIHPGGVEIRFSGLPYLHSPTLFTLEALFRTVEQMDIMPLDAEHGYTDRYVGAAVTLAGVPVLDLSRCLAWSTEEVTAAKVDACRHAIAAGAIFTHGIKTAEVLDAILPWSQWHTAAHAPRDAKPK